MWRIKLFWEKKSCHTSKTWRPTWLSWNVPRRLLFPAGSGQNLVSALLQFQVPHTVGLKNASLMERPYPHALVVTSFRRFDNATGAVPLLGKFYSCGSLSAQYLWLGVFITFLLITLVLLSSAEGRDWSPVPQTTHDSNIMALWKTTVVHKRTVNKTGNLPHRTRLRKGEWAQIFQKWCGGGVYKVSDYRSFWLSSFPLPPVPSHSYMKIIYSTSFREKQIFMMGLMQRERVNAEFHPLEGSSWVYLAPLT